MYQVVGYKRFSIDPWYATEIDQKTLNNRLEKLVSVDKKTEWIRADLTTAKSSRLGRICWALCKRVSLLRRMFYGVDLTQTRMNLLRIRSRIGNDENLAALFNKAAEHYNEVVPHHKVSPLKISPNAGQSFSLEKKIGDRTLRIELGDITKTKVDAIVNAANSKLLGGSGVDGAIHKAGGPEIKEECKKIKKEQLKETKGRLPTGQAVITGAGKLPARHVIHTVGPIYHKAGDEAPELLKSAYLNSLKLAESKQLSTVAFPSISTGVYGYPLDEAIPIALKTVEEFLRTSTHVKEVRFILFSGDTYGDFEYYLST